MWFSGLSGKIEICLTRKQAKMASHPGHCDVDVKALSEVPSIARQLAKIPADVLREELREYGAWDATQLADHQRNLQRILWVAAGDICDRQKGE